MTEQADYMVELEQLLKRRYGMTLEDVGLSTKEWLDRFGDESPRDAVEAFALKFDLTRASSV